MARGLLLTLPGILLLTVSVSALNYAPVIGIISAPLYIVNNDGSLKEGTDLSMGMIPASYEKWIQTSGA
jgi:hypothetical protein